MGSIRERLTALPVVLALTATGCGAVASSSRTESTPPPARSAQLVALDTTARALPSSPNLLGKVSCKVGQPIQDRRIIACPIFDLTADYDPNTAVKFIIVVSDRGGQSIGEFRAQIGKETTAKVRGYEVDVDISNPSRDVAGEAPISVFQSS